MKAAHDGVTWGKFEIPAGDKLEEPLEIPVPFTRTDDAKLVQATPKGSHRIYAVRAEGLEALRRYLDGFWDETLAAFSAEITNRNRLR